MLAKIEAGSTTYYHPDSLSTRLMTDSSGTVIGQQGHYPYGEQWYAQNTTTKWFFTTYERDAESGNDYSLARYYVNRVGRFSGMDPLAGDPGNPQSLNRYAYARNDPIDMSDPSGLCPAPDVIQASGRHDCVNWRRPSWTQDLNGGWDWSDHDPLSIKVDPGQVLVGGIPMDASVAQVAENMGFAVNCPQCQPGDIVAANGEVYEWHPGTIGTVCTGQMGGSRTDCGPPYWIEEGYWDRGAAVAANNGSRLQQGLNYLENHPVFISVNEIVAAQITVQWSTKTVCANLGAGASVPPTKAVTVGVYNGGNMSNWENVLSSWGFSFGARWVCI